MEENVANVIGAIIDHYNNDEEKCIQILLYLYRTTNDAVMRNIIFDIINTADRCVDCGCKLQWMEYEEGYPDDMDIQTESGFWYCPQCDDERRRKNVQDE